MVWSFRQALHTQRFICPTSSIHPCLAFFSFPRKAFSEQTSDQKPKETQLNLPCSPWSSQWLRAFIPSSPTLILLCISLHPSSPRFQEGKCWLSLDWDSTLLLHLGGQLYLVPLALCSTSLHKELWPDVYQRLVKSLKESSTVWHAQPLCSSPTTTAYLCRWPFWLLGYNIYPREDSKDRQVCLTRSHWECRRLSGYYIAPSQEAERWMLLLLFAFFSVWKVRRCMVPPTFEVDRSSSVKALCKHPHKHTKGSLRALLQGVQPCHTLPGLSNFLES